MDPDSSTIECVLLQLMTGFYAFSSSMAPVYVLLREDVPRFADTQIKFLSHISSAYGLGLSEVKRLYGAFALFLEILQKCSWMNSGFIVVTAIWRPWSPELVSSLTPNVGELD